MTDDDEEGPPESPPAVSEEEVREALQAVEAAASTHGANYASGMREARRVVETRLLGGDA